MKRKMKHEKEMRAGHGMHGSCGCHCKDCMSGHHERCHEEARRGYHGMYAGMGYDGVGFDILQKGRSYLG